MSLKDSILKGCSSINKSVKKNSPAILTVLGVAGFVGTVYMTYKASPKAHEILEEINKKEAESEKEIKPIDKVKDRVVALSPIVAPAVVMGVSSIGCFVGAYSISARRLAGLASAYSISEERLRKYKKHVEEVIGEKKAKQISNDVIKDEIAANPPTAEISPMDQEQIFYEYTSGRYFTARKSELIAARDRFNMKLASGYEQYMTLNEWYDEIGISHTTIGDTLGWNSENRLDIDISEPFKTPDDRLCWILNYDKVPPIYDFRYNL